MCRRRWRGGATVAKLPDVHVVDFETEAIQPRPVYPPRPVSVAVLEAGATAPVFVPWGHPGDRSGEQVKAAKLLKRLWRSGTPILCHNAKFDLDVGETFLELGWPRGGFHDTELLAFLHDPHSRSLSLKPLAEKLLHIKPTEQDHLKDWLQEHVKEARGKGWGAYISRAPSNLVGPYAVGDVTRTKRLFKFLWREVITLGGMEKAYDRECRLLPVLLRMERRGIPVWVDKMAKDLMAHEADLETLDAWVRRRLKAPTLDIDSGTELADALDQAGLVEAWIETAKGNRSTAAENLIKVVKDTQLVTVLGHRAKVANGVRTFLRPWRDMAAQDGLIYTNWNQVRHADERNGGLAGTRSGRLSSTPNLQNVKRDRHEVERLIASLRRQLNLGAPFPKDYVKPRRRGGALLQRDYSQQELRILAYFEQGPLRQAYLENPRVDLHEHARVMINNMLNTNYDRKPIKNTSFGILYGMGIALLAERLGLDITTSKKLKQAYLEIYPGLRQLIKNLKAAADDGLPIWTWGGRRYFVEPPLTKEVEVRRFGSSESELITKVVRSFEYKLLNYLIQGSAADNSKDSLILLDKECDAELLLTVHDEFLLDLDDRREAPKVMKQFNRLLAAVDFDGIEMLSDGKFSTISWGAMKEWDDEKGKVKSK